jgi:hypothetical protein
MTLETLYGFVNGHGVEGVLLVWLWLERDERVSSQRELSKISQDTVMALNGMRGLLDQAVSLLHGHGKRQ